MLTIRPILVIKPSQTEKRFCDVTKSTFVHKWGLDYRHSLYNKAEISFGLFSTSTDDYKLIWELTYKYIDYSIPYGIGNMALKLLKCESRSDIEIQAICELGVTDKMGKCINETWVQSDLLAIKIIEKKNIQTCFNDSSLVLDMKIKIRSKDKINYVHKVLDDMSKLIKTGDNGDIAFVIGDEEIKAHELILKVRNETFAKMFECDMTEKKTKRVRIEEMDATVFKELLHYIYTEKEPTIDKEKIKELLLAAEKYGIHDLKTWCSQEIVKTINHDNFTDIFNLADLVNSEFIKDKVIQFALENKISDMKVKLMDVKISLDRFYT